ncbi:hypothetical protein [Planktothrix phage Pra-JY27]|nr:hypothetical protein [Planktothrix phage Pag-Yong1]WEV89215.1 hypothetical protein [Synechococcus phage MinM2]
MGDDLIPLDKAVACLWPAGSNDPRLRIRVEDGPLGPERMRRLTSLGGRCTIIDPTGTGDARVFYNLLARSPGWAREDEVRRELGALDCDFGRKLRIELLKEEGNE